MRFNINTKRLLEFHDLILSRFNESRKVFIVKLGCFRWGCLLLEIYTLAISGFNNIHILRIIGKH